MTRTFLTGGIVYTGSEVVEDATVVLEGNSVAAVLRAGSPRVAEPSPVAGISDDLHLDAAGRLITPGLINAHTHAYSALARGIPLKDPPPTNFQEILERLWWKLDAALTLEEIDLSARLHGMESLRAGVTTLFDHHASQGAVRGSLSVLGRAFGDLGLRSCLCFEVSDRAGAKAAREGIEENLDFLESTRREPGEMLRARFGLHASFTLSNETLAMCRKAVGAAKPGFHVHVAEDLSDQTHELARSGRRVLERLSDAGVLDDRTLCVHGVHLDDREIALLAETRAWLVHCPESNQNNGVGAAMLARFREAGVRLALGTDGFTPQVAREALVGHLLQNHLSGDPRTGWAEVPNLLQVGNVRLAEETFGVRFGRIEAGAAADLVVWEYLPPTPVTPENFWGHLLFGLAAARAADVFVAGRRVLHDGQPTGLEERDLVERCRTAAARLWERL